MWPPESFLPACSQKNSSLHTPPVRLLPFPYGTQKFMQIFKEKTRMPYAWGKKRVGAFACSEGVCVFICLQSCPQMALQCYRKALETDPRCVCALYQSTLMYRQLGNTQAEIQALRLLHSVSTAVIQCILGRYGM